MIAVHQCMTQPWIWSNPSFSIGVQALMQVQKPHQPRKSVVGPIIDLFTE